MDEEKNKEETPAPQEPYTPASRSTRVAAWIGVILMVILVIAYTYSLATGSFLNW